MQDDRRTSSAAAGGSSRVQILEVRQEVASRADAVAAEEPLEIRVVAGEGSTRSTHAIAVTMRTPGNDDSLAAGFLVSEGVVSDRTELWRTARCDEMSADSAENVLEVHLVPGVPFDPRRFSRHVFTSSSCGICGVASIERLAISCTRRPRGDFRLVKDVVCSFPGLMADQQTLFSSTGGLHAAALFADSGRLLLLREDVGRHNAVDKVVGEKFLDGRLPLDDTILVVSGRASFELVQKALMAGIPTLAAVGAPSSLAVSTAREFGMTLIGFLKVGGFNVYAGEQRLALE
jgi:FdhD protein